MFAGSWGVFSARLVDLPTHRVVALHDQPVDVGRAFVLLLVGAAKLLEELPREERSAVDAPSS